MREKNIWERIRNSSNCRVLILNLILTLCLNLLLEFTERRSVGEVITFVQERTFVFLYNGFIIFLCFSIVGIEILDINIGKKEIFIEDIKNIVSKKFREKFLSNIQLVISRKEEKVINKIELINGRIVELVTTNIKLKA